MRTCVHVCVCVCVLVCTRCTPSPNITSVFMYRKKLLDAVLMKIKNRFWHEKFGLLSGATVVGTTKLLNACWNLYSRCEIWKRNHKNIRWIHNWENLEKHQKNPLKISLFLWKNKILKQNLLQIFRNPDKFGKRSFLENMYLRNNAKLVNALTAERLSETRPFMHLNNHIFWSE